jgi:hypothetical protein
MKLFHYLPNKENPEEYGLCQKKEVKIAVGCDSGRGVKQQARKEARKSSESKRKTI